MIFRELVCINDRVEFCHCGFMSLHRDAYVE